MLQIQDLSVSVDGREILKNINLHIKKGERHVIFGPNASGKTTLAMTLIGIPTYKVTSGRIVFEDKDLTKLSIVERARLGIFLAFQNPPQIRGMKVGSLIQLLTKEKAESILQRVYLDENILTRELGVGFSGGEKKRLEIAQTFAIKPKLLILDEIDSGVDIESLRLIGSQINKFLKQNKVTLLAITHYGYILDYLDATKAHVMIKGRIACSGNPKKIWKQIAKRGYKWCEECLKR